MEISKRNRSCVRHFKPSCFAKLFITYLQNVRSKKTNKKQFKILDKGKYVTPNIWRLCDYWQWSNNEWWWIPPAYWTFKDVEIQMLHDNTFPLLLYWFLHNSNTGLKIVQLHSTKNTMTHMLFLCHESFSKYQLVSMTFFSSHAQNLEFQKSY